MDTVKKYFSVDQRADVFAVNHFDDVETNKLVSKILDIIFNVIISLTMFLCFFSLCSSMSANLFDQTKEIGILRAMGYTKRRIQFVYFMEAFILVMASCICGLMIGTTVSVTMTLQQTVFTQIPFVFYFPWS
jgi:ABC-type antimicrobial peptide transport system permease subunit